MTGFRSLLWFGRHEARLAWRDWIAVMSGGRPGRERIALFGVMVFVLVLHLLAFTVVGNYPSEVDLADTRHLLVLTGAAFFAWTLMLAQALESVTRVVYGRADLDLVAASPAPMRHLIALRCVVAAFSTTMMSAVIVAPVIDALAIRGGAHWLGGYVVLVAMGAGAASFALLATVVLFASLGPRRTRTVSQIVAAVIGAGFVIAAQAVGIMAYGQMGRFALLRSDAVVAAAPGPDSPLWWPARAATGEPLPMLVVLLGALGLFGAVVAFTSGRFAVYAIAAAGAEQAPVRRVRVRARSLSGRSPGGTLRAKELRLLARDPWLLSQTLMQILYLIPPALMLWKGFGESADAPVMLAPVVVMAAGQLAGGLAWLAVSGEDAPDLVATAPITRAAMVRAKIEAVLVAVALPVAPLMLAFAVLDPWTAAAAAGGVACATASATAIQFFFRRAAKRSHFRRRQTASRFATFAEAFSSIAWAGTTGLAAASSWYAAAAAGFAAAVVAAAWLASPRHP
jgi:ABC-2 type transport system permease protein